MRRRKLLNQYYGFRDCDSDGSNLGFKRGRQVGGRIAGYRLARRTGEVGEENVGRIMLPKH